MIFDDPCPSRGRRKYISRFRLMVSQNLENVWSFSENLPNQWYSSPNDRIPIPSTPSHHPHLMLTVVLREFVTCTRGIPGDICRFIPGIGERCCGVPCRPVDVCRGIPCRPGGVCCDTSEPKPLLAATLRRDFSLNDTLSLWCALVGTHRHSATCT